MTDNLPANPDELDNDWRKWPVEYQLMLLKHLRRRAALKAKLEELRKKHPNVAWLGYYPRRTN